MLFGRCKWKIKWWEESTLNELPYAQMDGFDGSGVIMSTATNKIEVLDSHF